MFFDANEIQLSTETREVISEDTGLKYKAWNWNVIEIDGNNCDEIRSALKTAIAEKDRPTLIIGHCVMGKGCVKADGSSYEHDCGTHGAPLGGDAYINTIKNLGGNPDDPFIIYDEVQELYARRRKELKEIVAKRREEEKTWETLHPDRAQQLKDWFDNKLPQLPWSEIAQKSNAPTRNGSSNCLALLSAHVKNMIVASADLCNSDKTDGFLTHTTVIQKGDFSGGFIQAGVSELTMACICIGMTLHGGIITAMGTFFVFSDYMKPAIRMAALMELPVKFIWTHDSFRVGEDGPTHEPIEQEAQIRLMEKLKNHSGRDSVLVLRPADVREVTECWKLAMENTQTPTALIFSRQNVNNLPEGTNYSSVNKGAYAVIEEKNPDIVLLASGSEVSTLVSVEKMLKEKGIKAKVVSCPSEGLFKQQSMEYQESILPNNCKVFALTAGLPATFEGLVGKQGKIYGMNSFGFSAPFKVLEEKLGFTPENIYNEVLEYLNA